MIKDKKFSPPNDGVILERTKRAIESNKEDPISHSKTHRSFQDDNLRECPSCGLLSLKGMPGGRDATYTNCGYKDPCCYD